MIMSFIDRKTELEFLEERYKQTKPQLIILYGRRRVGKTELIKQFIRGKRALYFLAEKGRAVTNFERFGQRVAEACGQEGISFKGWQEAFEYLKRQEKKWVIAIDEFPWLIQGESAIPSVFQRIADETLRDSGIYLILCGSSVSVMEDKVLAYRSPLYGRRTGQWQLNPLPFRHARLFFPGYTLEEQVEAYAVAGNIPMYLMEFDERNSVKENIKKNILSRGRILYQEPKFVLNQEFSNAQAYFSIFEALAAGKNTVKEIADTSGIEPGNLNKYLNVLIRLHYVEKRYPMFHEKNKKRVRYGIRDNFFDFWFRFVNPNLSELEVGDMEKAGQKIFPQFNSYAGKKFEHVAQEALLELNRKKRLPFEFSRISNFWDKTREGAAVEIDRIAINEKEKKLLIVECKWEKNVSAEKLLAASREKTGSFPLFEKYELHYAFFAKSFRGGPKEQPASLIDLDGMEKALA